MTPDLDALMSLQAGVFSAAQADSCGVNSDELHRGRRARRLHVLRRGIYTTSERIESADLAARHVIDAAGALLARNALAAPSLGVPIRFAIGHCSAALLWDLPAPRPELLTISNQGLIDVADQDKCPAARAIELVGADRRQRTYAWGVHIRPATLPMKQVARHRGLPCTTIPRTAVDMARECSWEDSIILLDAALHGGATKAELAAVLQQQRGWRGYRQAERAIEFADGRSESVAESLARCVFAACGLPAPDLQVDMFDAMGKIGRVDMLFRDQRTIVEIDGKVKYTDPNVDPRQVAWLEKLREDRLRDAGWEVVRVTWAQLKSNPERVHARVLAAFARGARATG